jgi:hypothetical protein
MGDLAQGIRNFREGLKDPNDQRAIQDKQTTEAKKADEVKQG